MDEKKIYHGLCMPGGGMKSLYILGAVNELYIRKQLDLKYIAGTSAGAMIGYLLAIGYDCSKIFTELCSSYISQKFNGLNFLNLPSMYGIFPKSILYDKLKELTLLKLGYLPTFKDLYIKLNKYLIVTTYKLSNRDHTQRKIYLCPDTHPDMLAIEGVILSSAIPFIFERMTYENDIYVDGAYTSNFPINYLDKVCPQELNIVGVCFKDKHPNYNSFLEYIKTVLSISIDKQRTDTTKRVDVFEIALPDNNGIDVLSFSASTKEKISAFQFGANFIRPLLK